MGFKIQELRDELFDTLKKVKSGDVDINSARTVCDVASVIIDSARAETDFIKLTDSLGSSDFIPVSQKQIQ